jgi:aspartate aminotransferase
VKTADRLANLGISLIRQINALATSDTINLGIGEPNTVPDETLLDYARRAATMPWQYSPNAGNLSLRKKLAEGTPYDPKSEICVTSGTEEGLYAIFQAYVNPGDEVLLPNPGFLSYEAIAKICGATVREYFIEPPSWDLHADAILEKITPKTKLIVVNSPSNPLGSVVSKDVLEKIANAGVLVVSDEVYRDIWYDEPPASMLAKSENVITIGGLSKSHAMTGLRLGWVYATEAIMRPIITSHQYIATCTPVFAQWLAELILNDREWNESWLERCRSQFRTQREAALYAIEHELGARIEPPPAAFYAFAPVPSCDTLTFCRTLATDAAVLIIPGMAFGSLGEGWVRISYAASVENIGAGLERVGRYLRSAGR